jgi:hypothetical protein
VPSQQEVQIYACEFLYHEEKNYVIAKDFKSRNEPFAEANLAISITITEPARIQSNSIVPKAATESMNSDHGLL